MPSNRGSQFGEDRIIEELLPNACGCYVDIGAWHPFALSNTIRLYDRGWRGLLIEPLPEMAALLAASRPGDCVLQLAASNRSGTSRMKIAGPLSSLEPAWANGSTDGIEVQTDTLRRTMDQFPEIRRACDFCSVDVEGHERAVLEGWDWVSFRPRLLLIESVEYDPKGSARPTWPAWEPILIENGYRLERQFEINRLYMRTDHGGK